MPNSGITVRAELAWKMVDQTSQFWQFLPLPCMRVQGKHVLSYASW